MVRKIMTLAFAVMAIAMLTSMTVASLIPMSWGFPVLIQNQTLSSSDMEFANAADVQSAAVSFPTTGTSGILGASFPTILQTGNQDQTALKLATMDQTASSTFAYPWFSMGGSPVPSMGLL